jgi:hypothetical protein
MRPRDEWCTWSKVLVLAVVSVCALTASTVLLLCIPTSGPVLRLRFSFSGEAPVLGGDWLEEDKRGYAVTEHKVFLSSEPGEPPSMHGVYTISRRGHTAGEVYLTHSAEGATFVSAATVPVRLELQLPSGARVSRTLEPGKRLVIPY